MEGIWSDIRFGLRSLMTNVRFTAVALLTIVLTVGGITTVFTLVNAVLLRPLPYPDQDRLVLLKQTDAKGAAGMILSPRTFLKITKDVPSFESAAFYPLGYTATVDPETNPLDVQSFRVSPQLFPIIGLKTVLGRPLAAEDAKPDAPAVAVIGYEVWQNHFGGAKDILGKPLLLQKDVYSIVGVAVPDVDVPTNWLSYPGVFTAVHEPYTSDIPQFHVVAKLRPGASIAGTNAELKGLSSQLEKESPDTNRGQVLGAAPVLDEIVGDSGQALWIFLGAVSCVLLIGIANLIGLQIVRNSAREREICVRAALGAGRWRLVRQLLVETLLLSLTGGLLGIAAAWGGIQVVIASLPARFPRADHIALDLTVFTFAMAVSLFVGIMFGIVPARCATRLNLVTAMNEGSRNATMSSARSRIQSVLIAFETAIALVLLIGAALLSNSFGRLISQDAGMQERNLWATKITLPQLQYRNTDEQIRFWNAAMDSLRGLPQVQSATMMPNALTPLAGVDMGVGGIFPEGKTGNPQDGLKLSWRKVDDAYFDTLGIPILKGRAILKSDTLDAPAVAVLNEVAAAKLWPGQDPIGKRVAFGKQMIDVVGIIRDFKLVRLDGEPAPQIYTSYQQWQNYGGTNAIAMIRSKPGASGVASAIQATIGNLEKESKVTVSTMDDVRWKLLATERFRTGILLLFAGGAIFLAVVGIFGVVSYSVVQRHREIGVRLALGATYQDVVQLMLRQALVPAALGLLIGIPVALAATRLLTSYMFEITPTDPMTFGVAALILAIAALIAGLLPARRAVRVDPMIALRHE